jgi:hypothetical protein
MLVVRKYLGMESINTLRKQDIIFWANIGWAGQNPDGSPHR